MADEQEVYVDDPRLESAPHTSEDETEEVNRVTAEEPEGEEPEEPKEAEPEEPESGESEDAEESGEDTAAKPKKNTAQERIAELTRLRREAERERDAYRQMAQELAQGKKQEEPQQQTQEPLKPPRRYDYSSDDEYDAALATYTEQRAAQIARQEVQQYQQKQQQTEAQRKQQEALQQVSKAEQEFAAEREDYFEVIETASPLNDDAVRQVLPAEAVPKVLYHLHQNPDEAQRIADLPTTEQAVYEIGKLESSLSQQPRHNTTKAPNPPRTVKGAGASTRKWRDDMPLSEVEKRLGYKQ